MIKRSKKLYILTGILLAASLLTLGISQIEQKKEDIKASGETILSIPVSDVVSFSFKKENDDSLMAFHKKEDQWIYDEDEMFPVSNEKVETLLEQFENFSVAFTIDGVENFEQYGLENPKAVINLETKEEKYEIKIGDYSKMDEQRYISIGDDKVYLALNDPMDKFDITLKELIQHDKIPTFDDVNSVQFVGEDGYEIIYQEEGEPSYRQDDVWFTTIDGILTPLDPELVDGYLLRLSNIYLSNYADYYVAEDELSIYGLDNPELTINISYSVEDESGTSNETFTIQISRDPSEVEELESSDSESDEEQYISAYARIGHSNIIYRLDSLDYDELTEYTYHDLCYKQIFPAEFEDISNLSVNLDGNVYNLYAENKGDEQIWYYNENEIDEFDLKNAIIGIKVNEFVVEEPVDKLEVSFTTVLNLENSPEITVELYRYDGESCLAVVDDSPVGLVDRSKVVDFIEAVNSIILK